MKQYVNKKMNAKDSAGWKGVLINTAIMCGIILFTILFTELLRSAGFGMQSLLMIYLLSVQIISFVTPKYVYGTLAALICTFSYDFLVSEPQLAFSFAIGFPITLFTMLVVTFITSTLTVQLRYQATLAVERERRAELLSEISQALLAARDVDAIVRLVSGYLAAQIGRPVILYTKDPKNCGRDDYVLTRDDESAAVFLTDTEKKRAHRVYKRGVPDALDEYNSDVHYEAVVSRGTVFGVIGIDCKAKPLAPTSLAFLQILIKQAALALELLSLSDEKNNLKISAEKEKMRSNLLRSISHDLRTPLTSILGASAAILDEKDMPEEMRQNLVSDIHETAQWLIRMVENILTVTRISKESLEVHKTLEAAEELISQAVSIVRARFPECHIHVRIPDELLLVPMDGTLISQVLINLLENAIKYSEEGALVLVNLKKQGDYARFEVIDHGGGISAHLLDNLFEIHTRGEGSAIDVSSGIGIGLSICQTIVKAHGGTIEGRNREEGGAKFSFMLPLAKDENGIENIIEDENND